jgi:hypothetical protein
MKTEPFLLEQAVDFLEPLNARSPFTASRLAILKDGSTFPVLRLLAERKFGSWPEGSFPFWIDGDSSNETLENVALAPRLRTERRRLGLPGGPDYRKRWRAANRERVRQYGRNAALRRALLQLLEKEQA